jgi:hypothetical protein
MNDILRASGELKYQLLKNREGQLIENPQVTFIDPPYSVVGETGVYQDVFSEESLDLIDSQDDSLGDEDPFGGSDVVF